VNSSRKVILFRCRGHKLQEQSYNHFGQLTIKRSNRYLLIGLLTGMFL